MMGASIIVAMSIYSCYCKFVLDGGEVMSIPDLVTSWVLHTCFGLNQAFYGSAF